MLVPFCYVCVFLSNGFAVNGHTFKIIWNEKVPSFTQKIYSIMLYPKDKFVCGLKFRFELVFEKLFQPWINSSHGSSQLIFTCSNSTKKHWEKLQNMFKVHNKNTRATSMTSLYCFYR